MYIKRTIEESIAIAKTYDSRSDLMRDYPGVYSSLYKKGLLDDIIPVKKRGRKPNTIKEVEEPTPIEKKLVIPDSPYNIERLYNQLVYFVREDNSTIEKMCRECGIINELREYVIERYYSENKN